MSAVQGLTHLMLSHRQAPLINAALILSVEMSLNDLQLSSPNMLDDETKTTASCLATKSCVHTMLTHQTLYEIVNTKCMQASLLLKIMAGHYAAIAGYSADLRSLVKRCLTQSPDRRPNTGDRAFCFS